MPEPEKTGYEDLKDEDLIKHYKVNKHDYLKGCNLTHEIKDDNGQAKSYNYEAADFLHSIHGKNNKFRNALEALLDNSKPSEANENIKKNLKLIHKELEERQKKHKQAFEKSKEHKNNTARQQMNWNLNPFNFIRGIVAGAVEILGILTKPIYIGKHIQKMSKYLVKDLPDLQKVNGKTADQDYDNKKDKKDMFNSVTMDASVIIKHLDSKTNPEASVDLKADLYLINKFQLESKVDFTNKRNRNRSDINEMRKQINQTNPLSPSP